MTAATCLNISSSLILFYFKTFELMVFISTDEYSSPFSATDEYSLVLMKIQHRIDESVCGSDEFPCVCVECLIVFLRSKDVSDIKKRVKNNEKKF